METFQHCVLFGVFIPPHHVPFSFLWCWQTPVCPAVLLSWCLLSSSSPSRRPNLALPKLYQVLSSQSQLLSHIGIPKCISHALLLKSCFPLAFQSSAVQFSAVGTYSSPSPSQLSMKAQLSSVLHSPLHHHLWETLFAGTKSGPSLPR